jgi:hypothetical protein
VRGGLANGESWLAKAERTLAAAATLVNTEPSSAITLAYDAARFAALAVLAHQGLRARQARHYANADRALREVGRRRCQRIASMAGAADLLVLVGVGLPLWTPDRPAPGPAQLSADIADVSDGSRGRLTSLPAGATYVLAGAAGPAALAP